MNPLSLQIWDAGSDAGWDVGWDAGYAESLHWKFPSERYQGDFIGEDRRLVLIIEYHRISKLELLILSS